MDWRDDLDRWSYVWCAIKSEIMKPWTIGLARRKEKRDPDFKTDRLASAILEFPSGQSIFTCSTQAAFFQRMHFLGTSGRVEIEIPWNAPNDRPCRIFLGDVLGAAPKVEEFPVVDQYTIQGDEFSRAVRGERDVPVPLEDAIKNMAAIEAIFRAADSGKWEQPEKP